MKLFENCLFALLLIFISRYFLCQFESFFSQLFIFNKYALAYYWMGYKFNAMIIHLHSKKIENKRKNDSSVGCSSCFCGSERHFQTNPSPIEKIQWYQLILKTHRFKKTRFIFLFFSIFVTRVFKTIVILQEQRPLASQPTIKRNPVCFFKRNKNGLELNVLASGSCVLALSIFWFGCFSKLHYLQIKSSIMR